MVTQESCKWPSKYYGERLTRRVLLTSAFAGLATAQSSEVSPTDLSLIDDVAVPNELFFIREHFPQPDVLSAATWKLSVAGKNYSFDDVIAKPGKTLSVTLECAENATGGGLVSHAEWRGVSLASLLPPDTKSPFLRLISADGYSRTIPGPKALHPDTIIAYGMNGEKLPLKHGFPLRAIIPGWYGMDAVKWLRRVELLEREERSHPYVRRVNSFFGIREAEPVTAMQVKSVFTRPQDGAILMKRRFILRGMAWAGENRVAKVEVSVDGGTTWHTAALEAVPVEYSWLPWSFDWKVPHAGEYTLIVRARDDKGREQPGQRATERSDGYELNDWQTVKVTAV
jgi:DMSO/TMAO reductase YedYZ molybdopterin-dependent catalytic subunit